MKVKLMERDESLYSKTAKNSVNLKIRNTNENANPMATLREYQRALHASKIERIFAKPFVHSFTGHTDSVKALCRSRVNTQNFFSASFDGELKYWSIVEKKCIRSIKNAHDGIINSITTNGDDSFIFTASNNIVKQWSFEKNFNIGTEELENINNPGTLYINDLYDTIDEDKIIKPAFTYLSNSLINSIDYNCYNDQFITAGETITLWDVNVANSVNTFKWGNDNYLSIKYSLSEPSLLLAASYDNSINLIDIRVNDIVQKVYLSMRTNSVVFNPMRPTEYALANDNHNVYAFDLRNFQKAKAIHSGFVSAALDVDYNPNGLELCAGSHDQTIRVWNINSSKSKEIYHNKRMQSVLQTKYSGDGVYILAGSADMNIRLWKSNASAILRHVSVKEQQALNYRAAIKRKYAHMPEIKNILEKRQVPKYILNQTRQRYVHSLSEKKKEQNRITNDPRNAERGPLKKEVIQKVEFEDRAQPERKYNNNKNVFDDESDTDSEDITNIMRI